MLALARRRWKGASRSYNTGQMRSIAVLAVFATFGLSLPGQKKPVTIEAVSARQRPDAAAAGQAVWAPDGTRFVYRRGSKLILFDAKTKSETDAVSFDVLEKASVSPAEPEA